jgi:putative inorganic carbon (HCO3(-)) transporter
MRTIFVLIIAAIGGAQALRGPFQALLFYLWIAYFRPDQWVWDSRLLYSLQLSFWAGLYFIVRALPSIGKARFDLRAMTYWAFLILTFLSAWTSDEPISWIRWEDFGKTTIVGYFLYAVLSQDIKHFRIALIVIALSLGFEGAKQAYGGLITNPGARNLNEIRQLGDNNGVAVGMTMLVSLFIALSRTTENKWERKLYLFFIIGVVYRAITTYSRGGFLAITALAMMYVARSNHKMKTVLGVAVVAAIVLPVLPPAFWDRMATMNVRSEGEMDDSAAGRVHFWRVATVMAADHPLLGVGYNSFNEHYDQYDFLDGRYGRDRSVHSMWFAVLAELGYIGLALYILMFILALSAMQSVARLARKGDLPGEFYQYAVSLQAAFVAAMVGGTFLPWAYIEMLWHFFALSMALRQIALNTVKTPVAEPLPSFAQRRTA